MIFVFLEVWHIYLSKAISIWPKVEAPDPLSFQNTCMRVLVVVICFNGVNHIQYFLLTLALLLQVLCKCVYMYACIVYMCMPCIYCWNAGIVPCTHCYALTSALLSCLYEFSSQTFYHLIILQNLQIYEDMSAVGPVACFYFFHTKCDLHVVHLVPWFLWVLYCMWRCCI